MVVLEWTLVVGFNPSADKRKQRVTIRAIADATGLTRDHIRDVLNSAEFKAARDDALAQLHPSESPVVQMLHQRMGEIAWAGVQRLRKAIADPGTSVTEVRQITFGLLDRIQINGQGIVNKALEGIRADSVLILQGLSPEAAAEYAEARKTVLVRAAAKAKELPAPTIEAEGEIAYEGTVQ